MDLFEVVGWVGAVLVLFAYWLVTKVGTSLLYHVLNLLGAAGLLVNALHHGALPSTTVNLVWAAIAVWGVAVMTRRRAPE
jgi:formate hydrogenlyase subunit 3/multisubunit Na+/H+ antiporter MnhD subunit